ncbi:phage tail protein [Shimia haliotis]|uniref:Microcystin-dependent protein n=1 Tax=Shimia haliotis TaxID=1280847 RepID=A0A1I4FJX2_9RHOB|nr:tail fiber protein [Shimia haliotis]SFL16761.1 Microcystin-dependent protein [Shimia haliotis]
MKKLISHVFAATLSLAGTSQIAQADEPFVGEIRQFGFNFCPRGWAPLDGQLLAVSGNDALFSLLGTIYGGDGRTTFGLPSLRGRIPLHTGTGPGLTPRPQGQKTGTEWETATIANLPSHTHGAAGGLAAQLVGSSENPNTNDPSGNYLPTGTSAFYSSAPGTLVDMQAGSVTVDLSGEIIGNNGGGQPVTNMAPTIVNNYCIALFGIYPSRS